MDAYPFSKLKTVGENAGKEMLKEQVNTLVSCIIQLRGSIARAADDFDELVRDFTRQASEIEELKKELADQRNKVELIISLLDRATSGKNLEEVEPDDLLPSYLDHGDEYPHMKKSDGFCWQIRKNQNGSFSRYAVKCNYQTTKENEN